MSMVLKRNSSHVAKSSNLYNVQDADFDNWFESTAISVERQNGSFFNFHALWLDNVPFHVPYCSKCLTSTAIWSAFFLWWRSLLP